MPSFVGLHLHYDQALRHSRVKLTWDRDDPERTQLTRRTLTKKEIDEADFKAYIASSNSGSDDENENEKPQKKDKQKKTTSRNQLRALLLKSDETDELPEGWGRGSGDESRDIDMEITFTPGLTRSEEDKDETTLEKYERKMKEKRKKRKETSVAMERDQGGGAAIPDDFFDLDSEEEKEDEAPSYTKGTRPRHKVKGMPTTKVVLRQESTGEELALIAASSNPDMEPKHFDLKAIMKAEKGIKGNRKKNKKKRNDGDEIQEDFIINVRDDRFKALHEDHTFAIDPSNPQHVYHYVSTRSLLKALQQIQEDEKHDGTFKGTS